MSEPRYPPDDPREWLNRARSNLALAKAAGAQTYLEELCFNAHQAAEKAIKGVFVKIGAEFPFTHDLNKLLRLLESKQIAVPESVWEAPQLNPYAFQLRYPTGGEVGEEQYRWALGVAEAVVRWAEGIVAPF